MAKKKTTAKAAEKKEEAIVEELVEEILDKDDDKGTEGDINVLENNPLVKIDASLISIFLIMRIEKIYKPYIIDRKIMQGTTHIILQGNISIFTDLVKELEEHEVPYTIDILDEDGNVIESEEEIESEEKDDANNIGKYQLFRTR